MKQTIIAVVLFLSTIFCQGQAVTYYPRQVAIKGITADGTRQNWVNTVAYFQIDTTTGYNYWGGSYGVYNNGTGAIAGSVVYYDSLNAAIAITNQYMFGYSYQTTPPYNFASNTYTVTRSLNSTFTVSTTKQAEVDYDVDISMSVSLLTGTQAATVTLEYSTDGGSTWKPMDNPRGSQALTVGISIGLVSIGTVKVTGTIPANAKTRITTSGTATCTWRFGKEKY